MVEGILPECSPKKRVVAGHARPRQKPHIAYNYGGGPTVVGPYTTTPDLCTQGSLLHQCHLARCRE